MALLLEALQIGLVVGQHRTHVEHDLKVVEARVERVCTGGVRGHVQTAAKLRPAVQHDTLTQKVQELVEGVAGVRVREHVVLVGLARTHVQDAELVRVHHHLLFQCDQLVLEFLLIARTQLQSDQLGHHHEQGAYTLLLLTTAVHQHHATILLLGAHNAEMPLLRLVFRSHHRDHHRTQLVRGAHVAAVLLADEGVTVVLPLELHVGELELLDRGQLLIFVAQLHAVLGRHAHRYVQQWGAVHLWCVRSEAAPFRPRTTHRQPRLIQDRGE
mmetsp:Transcript_34498/g.86669  ORF Transcript_34498/g.86669 Transcript_34498/m.86669 type:complete len:271 (+) Transcript_34498:663-1475(+)